MLPILVSHGYFLRNDPKQLERGKPYPPLATLQVAAMLRERGYPVSLFDAMLSEGLEAFQACLAASSARLLILYEDNFNFLTKMCLAAVREASCTMIRQARACGLRVIVAGSDATDAPEPYLRAGADAALAGEGLGTLLALIERLGADADQPAAQLGAGLGGIAYLDGGALVRGAQAGGGLMGYPERAAWDLVDIDAYRRVWQRSQGYFSLNIAASRGCPFRCSWCAKPIWGNQYAQRLPEAVADELIHLHGAYRPDHIWFPDDIFGFRPAWVRRFAARLKAAGVRVPFTIQTRADLLTESMAAALGEAGCAEAWLGAESGSQRILDAMNKGTTVEQILTARERLRAHGVRVGFFIQLGYLDEQLADIRATRALLERAQPDDVGVSVAYPLPGTRFYDIVKAQLNGKTHWRDSGDLAMMFKGTYSSDFYREIRNLLHEQVSLSQHTTRAGGRYERARRHLARRWDALESSEGRFRVAAAL